MTDPVTSLHYAPNGNIVNGTYAPGADGFNLADVSSAAGLNELPAGVKGLVWIGTTDGVTAAFKAAVDACIGNPNLYGFYLADEPNASPTIAANLKAEADYIYANVPGAKTFMVEQNFGSETSPSFYYTPANTDIELFGLDPYPVQTNVPNNLDYNIIPTAVSTAEKDGIPLQDIVPVYQAFGGGQYSTYILPTAAQEQQILSTWGSVVPNPAFDYAYSWGVQSGDTAISTDPALQAVFAAHNAGSTGSNPGSNPPPPTGPTSAPTVTIAGSGGTTTSAQQTVTGAVDLADAGSTVSVLDGTTKIGSATVAANGAWTANVTLTNQGANVLTATDTNAVGTGTSNSVTYTLETSATPPTPPTPPTSPTPPTLTIAHSTLSVDGHGGTVNLGISVTAPSGATHTTVTIQGLPKYETITDNLDHKTFKGSSIKLSEAQVDSGLTLTSHYRGNGDPSTKLTITASDTVGGVSSVSQSKTITVDDPPPVSASTSSTLALLNQFMSGFGNQSGLAPMTSNLSAALTHDEVFLTAPHHG